MKTKITRHKLLKFINSLIYKWEMSPSIVVYLKNTFFWLFHIRKCILIDGYLVGFYHKPPKNQNWGDDLNVFLLEKITNKKVLPVKTILLGAFLKRYMVIGSLVPTFVTRNTVIWGSGVYDLNLPMKNIPRNVLSVRGPLTREYLCKHNVYCPKTYGDPALLLPKYYTPRKLVKKKIGLIPHHRDYDLTSLNLNVFMNDEDIRLIDVAHYNENFYSIIDEICSCEIILSSSLHGLIVADAYSVKNFFCEFEYHHPNHDKYLDYYLSVGRKFQKPMLLTEALSNIHLLIEQPIENIQIDLNEMLSVMPFKV